MDVHVHEAGDNSGSLHVNDLLEDGVGYITALGSQSLYPNNHSSSYDYL